VAASEVAQVPRIHLEGGDLSADEREPATFERVANGSTLATPGGESFRRTLFRRLSFPYSPPQCIPPVRFYFFSTWKDFRRCPGSPRRCPTAPSVRCSPGPPPRTHDAVAIEHVGCGTGSSHRPAPLYFSKFTPNFSRYSALTSDGTANQSRYFFRPRSSCRSGCRSGSRASPHRQRVVGRSGLIATRSAPRDRIVSNSFARAASSRLQYGHQTPGRSKDHRAPGQTVGKRYHPSPLVREGEVRRRSPIRRPAAPDSLV